MGNRLEGKVAAVTGAASGFGATIARRFAEEGCRLVLGDIQREPGEALADSLGDDAVFTACNVTKEADIAAMVDLAVDRFGALDIMINNAGIVGAVGPIDQTDSDEWHATVDILLNGVFYGMKHAARVMKPRGTGAIISLASTAGILGGQGPTAYCACKHAVIGLTKNVAAELCRFGIRVNAIAPGSMATPMVADVLAGDPNDLAKAREMLAENSPLIGRAGLPEDVANAALFLASEEAGYTNGHVLTTDAGLTIGASTRTPPFSEREPMVREAGRRGI